MKVTKIGKVLDSFIESELTAILISGKWGIGKTFAIQKYIESKISDKDKKIIYCSVFGKKSIYEINSEIYCRLKPFVANIGSFFSIASKLISLSSVGNVGISLNLDAVKSQRRVKKYKNKQVIVILDDFERKGNEIDADNFLGYINNLTDDGIKIVVCSNLEQAIDIKIETTTEVEKTECDKNIFLAEKLGRNAEKVFDRVYFIEEADDEIVNLLIGENILDPIDFKIFDKNLRIVKKAKALFSQVEKHLNSSCSEWQSVLSKKDLFIISTYVIQEILLSKYSLLVNENLDEKGRLFLSDDNNKKSWNMSSKINAFWGRTVNRNLFIDAIIDVAIEEDYQFLDKHIEEQVRIKKTSERDIINSSLLLQSDAERKTFINKQIDFLLSIKPNDVPVRYVRTIFSDWNYCTDDEIKRIESREKELFENLYFIGQGIFEGGIATKALFLRYRDLCIEKAQQTKREEFANKSDAEIADKIREFSMSNGWHPSEMDDWKQFILENNFFIKNLHGKVNKSDWEIAISVCKLYETYYKSYDESNEYITKLREFLRNYIKTHDKDLSCKQRINYLFKEFNLDISQIVTE